MNSGILHLFNKVVALQFYRVNSSFFFLVLAFAGGFMRAQDHLALGLIITSSLLLTLIPVLVWLSYAMFVADYNQKLIARAENNFLNTLRVFPDSKILILCFSTAIAEMMPAIFYAAFLAALSSQSPAIVGTILAGLILCISVTAGLLYFTIKRRYAITLNLPRWTNSLRKIPKPYPVILFHDAFQRQPVALIGYKMLSILILQGALIVSGDPAYDLRLAGLAATVSFNLGIGFVSHWHRFDNDFFPIYRRLPISGWQRFGYVLLIVAVYCTPEILVIIKNFPAHLVWQGSIILYLYGASFHALWYSLHYLADRKPENIVSFAALLTIGYFLTVLAGFPLFVLATLNFCMAITVLRLYYRRFEYTNP
jgi:hypothetical protein